MMVRRVARTIRTGVLGALFLPAGQRTTLEPFGGGGPVRAAIVVRVFLTDNFSISDISSRAIDASAA